MSAPSRHGFVRARPEDADRLETLARAALGAYGDVPGSSHADHPDLAVSAVYLRTHPTWMVVRDGVLVGWGALVAWGRHCRLEHLWIAPEQQRQGIGRLLLGHLAGLAWDGGWQELEILSEPRAVGFYEQCGALRIGELTLPGGGTLPRLVLRRVNHRGTTLPTHSPSQRDPVPEEAAGQGL